MIFHRFIASLIIGSFSLFSLAMEMKSDFLTKSMISHTEKIMIEYCKGLLDRQDKTIPVLLELANRQLPDYVTYARFLLNQNYLTPQDFMWLVREHASPSKLNQEQAHVLFDELVMRYLKEEPDNVTKLLTEVVITNPSESVFYTVRSAFVSPDFRDEVHNVISKAIEENLPAVSSIIEYWPKNKYFLKNPAYARKEYIVDPSRSYFSSSQYVLKEYSMVEWLLRKEYGTFVMSNKPQYSDAAKYLVNKYSTRRKIGSHILYLAALLDQNHQLPSGLVFDQLIQKVDPKYPISKQYFSDAQLKNIENFSPTF